MERGGLSGASEVSGFMSGAGRGWRRQGAGSFAEVWTGPGLHQSRDPKSVNVCMGRSVGFGGGGGGPPASPFRALGHVDQIGIANHPMRRSRGNADAPLPHSPCTIPTHLTRFASPVEMHPTPFHPDTRSFPSWQQCCTY